MGGSHLAPISTTRTHPFRLCFADPDRTAAELCAIEGINCLPTLDFVRHLNQPKATRLAGVLVANDGNNVDTANVSVRFKQLADRAFRSSSTQIIDINVRHGFSPLFPISSRLLRKVDEGGYSLGAVDRVQEDTSFQPFIRKKPFTNPEIASVRTADRGPATP